MEDTELVKAGQFLIRVRKGNWEIEVAAPDKDFVVDESNRLIEQFRFSDTVDHLPEEKASKEEAKTQAAWGQPRSAKPQTATEFFRQLKLQTHLDKILVLGYWCEVKQGQPHFTADDILAKYKEVKEPSPANIRRDLGSLVGKGLLLSDGKSEDGALVYELTNTGIKDVESKIP